MNKISHCIVGVAAVLVVGVTGAAHADTGICCQAPSGPAKSPQAVGPAIQQLNGVITLTFEGLQNLEPVNSFYDGGTGGLGSGPGPNVGIQFNSDALAIIDADAGGTGNFGGEPSPDTILFFLTGSAVMNVPAGFTTGFSFFYSAINVPGTITVYDGPNATGNILAQLPLPTTPSSGAPDPSGQYSPLVPIGVAFNGLAKSVDFGGTGNQIGFDNITIGSATPGGTSTQAAPALSTWGLVAAALILTLSGSYSIVRRLS